MGMKLVYHPLSCVINKRFNTLLKKKMMNEVDHIFFLPFLFFILKILAICIFLLLLVVLFFYCGILMGP